MTKETVPFEQALEKLEACVQQLETGKLGLDDALKIFEEGTKLARQCDNQLGKAKGTVEQIVQQASGEVTTTTFEN